MKCREMGMLSWMILLVGGAAAAAATSEESETARQGRILNYRYGSGMEGMNFDHIISLWNRSSSASEEPPISHKWSMPSDRKDVPSSRTPSYRNSVPEVTTAKPQRLVYPESFPERFKMCLGQQQKKLADGGQGQSLLIKCFKTELISKLHRLLSNPDPSIKLFNGYVEFEKIKKQAESQASTPINTTSRKRYSARVSAKRAEGKASRQGEQLVPVPLKQGGSSGHGANSNDYYENYQKMLRELVARKSGHERIKRDLSNVTEETGNGETLQKTAKLFESGRKLLSEITNNLQNEEAEVENLTETILDPELVSTLNTFSRNYAVRLNFYPGISARMKRNQNSGVTFDLELDELTGGDDDDDDDEDDDGGRDDLKKKKKKIKIDKKTLKKLFPYLLIPFMIQAALLPFVLKFLLFVAIKALIAGKLALILVAFNVLKNSSHKSDDDEYAERMAVDHYGYGNGEEYGAWINRRTFALPPEEEEARRMHNDPYRAHDPK